MALGNIAGRAAFILDLDKSALNTGLPQAERQFATSTDRMAKSADNVGRSANTAGASLGGGAGLAGRMGLVGIAAATGLQALNSFSTGLRVTGAEAGATEGRVRNLGAELLQGDIIGGIQALGKQSYATDKQLAEMAFTAEDAAGRLDLIEASAAASSIGLSKLAGQIDSVVAAATRIDTTKLAFAPGAAVADSPAAPGGQKSFGITSLAGARQEAADLKNKNAAERRAELDQRAPRAIVDRVNQAALTPGLQDDLREASAQEAYFQNRLRGVKRGTERYSTILSSLKQAHSARQSIEDQIAAAEKSAADQSKASRERAAADRKAANDAAKRAAEQAAAEDARRLRAGLTLRETVLRNDLAAAELTEKNVEDDKKALRKLIAFDKKQEANRKLTLLERQQYRTKEIQDRAALAELNKPAGAKTAKEGGGTAADFKEMSFAFLQSLQGITNQFGSNVQPSAAPMDTHGRVQNHLTRRMIEHLSTLTAGQRNPEARYGRLEADTAMQATY